MLARAMRDENGQPLHKIVGAGPGWVDRIEAALKTGAISLPSNRRGSLSI
jgi:hypothetical protein